MQNPFVGQRVSFKGKNTHISFIHPDGQTVTVYGIAGAFNCKELEEPVPVVHPIKESAFTEAQVKAAYTAGLKEAARVEKEHYDFSYGGAETVPVTVYANEWFNRKYPQ